YVESRMLRPSATPSSRGEPEARVQFARWAERTREIRFQSWWHGTASSVRAARSPGPEAAWIASGGGSSTRARGLVRTSRLPPGVRSDNREVRVAVPLLDQLVHASGDRRQCRQRLVARGLDHQTHVLSCHRELEAGREVSIGHLASTAADGRPWIEELHGTQCRLRGYPRACGNGQDVRNECTDADDQRVSAQLVNRGQVGTLAEVFDSCG